MKQFYHNLQNYFKRVDDKSLLDKTEDLAIITLTVKKFLDLMFFEIERCGIDNVEFLAKSELFLSSVTTSYSSEKFLQILEVLKSVDGKIEQSLFYYGLIVLRKIITNDNHAILNVDHGNLISLNALNDNNSSEVSFFTHFLVENIILYCKSLRKLHSSKFMHAKDFRVFIDSKFDELVFTSINSLENMNVN